MTVGADETVALTVNDAPGAVIGVRSGGHVAIQEIVRGIALVAHWTGELTRHLDVHDPREVAPALLPELLAMNRTTQARILRLPDVLHAHDRGRHQLPPDVLVVLLDPEIRRAVFGRHIVSRPGRP